MDRTSIENLDGVVGVTLVAEVDEAAEDRSAEGGEISAERGEAAQKRDERYPMAVREIKKSAKGSDWATRGSRHAQESPRSTLANETKPTSRAKSLRSCGLGAQCTNQFEPPLSLADLRQHS